MDNEEANMSTVAGNQASTMNVRLWLFPLAALLIAGAFALPSFRGSPSRKHFAVGKQALDWRVQSRLGETVSIRAAESFQGKTVVLHFWGPWCGYCLLEMPKMVELEKRFRDGKHTAFLMVSCARSPEAEKTLFEESRAILAENGYDSELWTDFEFRSQAEMSRLGVLSGFPTTVAIDPAGRIAAVWNGYNERFPEEIAAYLAEAEKNGVPSSGKSP